METIILNNFTILVEITQEAMLSENPNLLQESGGELVIDSNKDFIEVQDE